MAICIGLILATIILRLTWLNKNNVAEIIGNYLNSTDQSLSKEQLILLAKQIRQPMWIWHIYLGYALTGLFLIRILSGITGKMKFQNPFCAANSKKEKFQQGLYLIFYICIALSLITGLFIIFGSPELKHTIEEIHKLSIYYLVGFLVLHFTGTIRAEFSDDKGITSRIIGGGK